MRKAGEGSFAPAASAAPKAVRQRTQATYSAHHPFIASSQLTIHVQVATYNEAAIAQAALGATPQAVADGHAAREKTRRQILDHFDRDNFKDDAHQEQMLSSVRSLDDDKASAAKKRKRKSTLDWKLCKSFAFVASSIPNVPIMLPGSIVAVVPQSLLTCASPPSNFPPRKLCSVCGYLAPYTDARA
jgi:hypothetical protein